MNKIRRSALSKIIVTIQDAQSLLESLRDEEQEYLDNMPEDLQNGIRGEAAQVAIDSMESALGSIEEIVEQLECAIDQ